MSAELQEEVEVRGAVYREWLRGRTVSVVGLARSGVAACRLLRRLGAVVLASDATHFYAHIDSRRVFRVLYNQGDMLEGYNTLERLASSKQHVIPGHAPLVLARAILKPSLLVVLLFSVP